MKKIDAAIVRISNALDQLENAIEESLAGEDVWGEASADMPKLKEAHDQLETEVHALRARAAEDAKLRAEAAEAVREALSDLRGAMTANIESGAPANA